MVTELWFYFTTVLICIGYALLIQHYPQWKLYFSIGLGVFIVAGAVLVYFDAKRKEEVHTKIGQMETMLDGEKKEKEKQQSLTRDATERARLLAEQLQVKSDKLATVLKDKPQIGGEIRGIRIFPWQQRASTSQRRTDDMARATGVLVFARVQNQGADTRLAHVELSIELPDNTVVKPSEWPIEKNMRIPCEDGPITISKEQSLDAKIEHALRTTEERSGVTVWMLKNFPLNTIETKDSSYTLAVRDTLGSVHALERYTLASLPQQCFGFEILD